MVMPKFHLLLKNPLLNNYGQPLLTSKFIQDTWQLGITAPLSTTKPFIISCFALSLDGKVAYPNAQSGFNIAKANNSATTNEKNADLTTLMLARSISDAIIIGTNSLYYEDGQYLPNINIEELNKARLANKKPTHLTTIIFCRDLDNINFNDILFQNNDYPAIICCFNLIQAPTIPHAYNYIDLSQLYNKQQLGLKNIINVDGNLGELIRKFKQIGFCVILNESPFFHHQLLEHKLLDEMWLNYSSSYIGGNITSLGNQGNAFTTDDHPDNELLTLHYIDYQFLYSRWRVKYSSSLNSMLRYNKDFQGYGLSDQV